jgi:predicted ATPase
MEAIGHLTRGLELLSTLPETVTNLEQELMFQAALGRPLIATKGWAAPETGHAYTRAWELCQQMEEAPQLFPVLFGLCAFYVVRAESQTAFDIAEESLRLARRTSDPVALLVAHRSAGTALFNLGELVAAQEHLEQCLALYDPQQHRGLAFLFGQDPRVTGLAILVWTLWIRGYPDQAVAKSDEMITFAQELSHPFSLAYALTFDGVLHQFRQEKQAVQVRSDVATTLATAQGFAQWVGLATLLRGWTLTREGQIDRGIVQMHQGLAAWRATGSEVWYPWSLSLLAEAYGKIGQTEEGLNLLSEAIAFMDKTRHCYYEAEPYRLRGELLLTRSADNHAEAETAFHAALERARCRQAKSLELRAATSLARLWQSQGKRQEAYELLAPVYGWFTEGFDTADLQEAKALLDTLPE